jgi:hypothetical protein
MADDPELTDGAYPSEETLARIEVAEAREALLLAERAWHYDGWATRTLRPEELAVVTSGGSDGDEEYIRFATGGWSGNESIIGALRKNFMVQAMCWQMSARGGLFIYEMPPATDAVDPHVPK